MAGVPRWAGLAGVLIGFAALAGVYIVSTGGAGRADACLGTTDPIERGVMVNTCDHPISVLACPRDPADGECVSHRARAEATFEVRADVAVIAHACGADYFATIADDGERSCRSGE